MQLALAGFLKQKAHYGVRVNKREQFIYSKNQQLLVHGYLIKKPHERLLINGMYQIILNDWLLQANDNQIVFALVLVLH